MPHSKIKNGAITDKLRPKITGSFKLLSEYFVSYHPHMRFCEKTLGNVEIIEVFPVG